MEQTRQVADFFSEMLKVLQEIKKKKKIQK